ncbi:8939_t:CDS:2 [Entrophospora sp. SA101]|nr:8939_t:CDS:2 [Entrophospora sp. SA101]
MQKHHQLLKSYVIMIIVKYQVQIFNTDFQVLLCGHSYHEECFWVLRLQCNYCYSYLSGVIDDLTKSYNERLNMDEDINNEPDLEINLQSEDGDMDAANILNIDENT